VIFLNIISKLSSMAAKISIERDWIIVIAKSAYDNEKTMEEEQAGLNAEGNGSAGDDGLTKKEKAPNKTEFKHELASINATVRRIDLFTAILAPLVAGLIMSFFNISPRVNGTVVSAIFFAIWNLISFVFEYSMLTSVYKSVPELEKPKVIKNKNDQNEKTTISTALRNTYHGWREYFSQGLVVVPSLALSVLYLTVLSFDGITIGYAKSQKLTETTISLFQGLGSIMGILGTIAFPLFHNRWKLYLPLIGQIGSIFQLSLLSICFVAIWLPGSPFTLANQYFSTHVNKCDNNLNLTWTNSSEEMNVTGMLEINKIDRIFVESPCYVYTSIIVLLSGMALSRFGLWLTDLVIHQIIQESVDEKKRGIIGGVQSSLNTIFDLIKYGAVILLSDVTQYGYLTIISISAVFIAFCLYTSYTIAKCATRDKAGNGRKKKFLSPTNEENEVEMQTLKS
jgi:iron-regulated transporter 1